MGLIEIGFRQLYLARGCDLSGAEEFKHSWAVDGFEIDIYLGKDPERPIVSQYKGVIPLDPAHPEEISMSLSFLPANKSEFAGRFFFEIFCRKPVEVPDFLLAQLADRSSEGAAKDSILVCLEAGEKERFRTLANFVSGTIGLRFHPQFMQELINENYWVYLENYEAWQTGSIYGPAIQILEDIKLNRVGQEAIKSMAFAPNISVGKLKSQSMALMLLRHGWQEHDAVYKFINLFTALEIAIMSTAQPSAENKAMAKRISELISNQADKVEIDSLLKFFNRVNPERVTIVDAFCKLAEESKFVEWENDVEAFRNFYRMRNRLVHSGDKEIALSTTTKNGKVINLERLVEHYLNLIIYGDDKCYQTRFCVRPKLAT